MILGARSLCARHYHYSAHPCLDKATTMRIVEGLSQLAWRTMQISIGWTLASGCGYPHDVWRALLLA